MKAYVEGAQNHVIIEGTLSAKNAAVVTDPGASGKNTITVWKIETPGYTAAYYEHDEETGGITLAEDTEGAKNIQYIIKVNQTDGATLKATDADGNALATVTVMINGVLYKIIIPAGANIAGLVGADGSVSFETLGQAFGISPV